MSTGRFFDRTIPFWGFHGSSEVLQTLLVAPPSWIQDGGAGNDVNQDLGRPFRSPLWRWRKMAALPLPAAILDDLIPGNWEWGHPRWRPEAEGPPSCATATMGIEKAALYYFRWTNGVYMYSEKELNTCLFNASCVICFEHINTHWIHQLFKYDQPHLSVKNHCLIGGKNALG